MAAGFTYNLTPEEVKEERYDVETGRRRRGPYKLDTTGLPIGEYLPSFTPIAADLKKKTATVCVRAKVVEAYTNGSLDYQSSQRFFTRIGYVYWKRLKRGAGVKH